jgi:hypothetical protein
LYQRSWNFCVCNCIQKIDLMKCAEYVQLRRLPPRIGHLVAKNNARRRTRQNTNIYWGVISSSLIHTIKNEIPSRL